MTLVLENLLPKAGFLERVHIMPSDGYHKKISCAIEQLINGKVIIDNCLTK